MPTSAPTPTPSSIPLRTWLTSVSTLVDDRRATSCDLARDLVAHGMYASPSRDPLREAGRIAEMARTDLGLAAAMLHHSQAAFMLDEAGAGQMVNGTLLWGMPGAGIRADEKTTRTAGWTLRGEVETCCQPPFSRIIYVVVDHERGHLLTVDLPDDEPPRTLRARGESGTTPATAEFDDTEATMRGRLGRDSLAHAITYGRLLEAAAWYGALTRLGDAMVATAPDEPGARSRHATTQLAEVDAILSATWGAIREGVSVWERGLSSMRTAHHHAARARTLTRLAASSVVFGYVPNEDVAAGVTGLSPTVREDLVAWMARGDLDEDAAVVAQALRTDGPSW